MSAAIFYTITADERDIPNPYTLRILEDGKAAQAVPGFADVHAAIEEIDRRYAGAAVYQLPFFFAELADESEVSA